MLKKATAALVLLQALLFALGLLRFMLREDSGYPELDDQVWPLPVAPLVLGAVVCAYAAFALLHTRLFGEGVGVVRAVANVVSVSAVLLFSAFLVLASTWARLSIVDVVYLICAAIVVAGCLQAFEASWHGRDAGSMGSL